MAKIYQVMGYALTGVSTAIDGTISDPRINARSPLLAWPELEEEDGTFSAPTLADYMQWLPSKGPEGLAEVRSIENGGRWSPHTYELIHTVAHEPESGRSDTLVLVPPAELGRWIRRANPMDTALATARGTELEVEVLHLEAGPEAIERFMDRRTGATVAVSLEQLRQLVGPDGDDEMALSLGYASAKEAWVRIVPRVPTSIRHLAEFAQLFTGPDTWKELRPVVYTYWA